MRATPMRCLLALLGLPTLYTSAIGCSSVRASHCLSVTSGSFRSSHPGLPRLPWSSGSAWKRGTSPDPDASVLPSGAHASASTGQSWHAGDALNCHDAVWCVCGSGLHSAVVRNQRESHIVMPPSKLAAATRRPSPE